MARASALLRSLSLGRRRNTRAYYARAPFRAGCGRATHLGRAIALARGFAPSARGCGATCQLRPPRTSRLSSGTRHACARHCALCPTGGGAAGKLASRALHRAGCVRSMCCKRPLHRREASLLRHAAAVRHASYGLQESAGFHVARVRVPLRSLSLGKRRSTRACCARAARRTDRGRATHYKRTLQRRKASLLRHAALVPMPAAASNNQPSFAWHARVRHCAHCLLGGGAARELAARARRAALVVVDPCTSQSHCIGESFFASACGRGATRQLRPPITSRLSHGTGNACARHCPLCLSGGGAARELSARAHRAALILIKLRTRQ